MRPASMRGTLRTEGGGTIRFSASGMMIPELCDLIKDATASGQATLDDFDRFKDEEQGQ